MPRFRVPRHVAAAVLVASGCSGLVSSQESPGSDGGNAFDAAPGETPEAPDAGLMPGSDTPTVLTDGSECFEGTYTPFWGDLHAHLRNHTDPLTCDYTAEEMFAEGKRRGLHFLHITEHVWRLTAAELGACKAAADASITDTFRPGCGFETNVVMANGSYSGHANAFFVPSNHNTDPSDAVGEDFTTSSGKSNFYSYVRGSSDLGQINHPNSTEDGWPDRAGEHADPAVRVVEVSGSCGGCADRAAAAISTFLALVEAGWQVGPSMNSDTHCLSPGRRTGLWVVADHSPVIGALTNRRTFVQSYDPAGGASNELALFMRKEGEDGAAHLCWMGSRLARPEGGSPAALRVRVRGPMVADAAPGSLTMKIYARGHGHASPLASAVCGDGPCSCDGDTCIWRLDDAPAADTTWFVAHAESTVAGEAVWALTAPVWLF